MTWKMLTALLIVLYLQESIDCHIEKIHKYSKDLVYIAAANTNYRQLIVTSAPFMKKHSDYVYFSNLNCNNNAEACKVEQHCLNCPNPSLPRTCYFEAPSNNKSILEEANLLQMGYNSELVVVDWVTKAIVNQISMRKIQLIDLNSCQVNDIFVKVSSDNNNRRKIMLTDDKYLELLFVDFKKCKSNGWLQIKYDMDKNLMLGPQCIHGIHSSEYKLAVEVVKRPNWDTIILDEDPKYCYLYNLPQDQNYAKELFKVSHKAAGSFNLPRLTADDDLVIFCWLPDYEFFQEINCVTGHVRTWFIKKFVLNFPYEVRDFEIQIDGPNLLYVLTSSKQETEFKCNYDLWAFEMNNELQSKPVKIKGPPCIFTHRLEPRPVMTTGLQGDVCVSFTFKHKPIECSISTYSYNNIKEQNFSALVECFMYYQNFSSLL